MVARTRFELVIFALRGRCPKPLDERAIAAVQMAEPERIELPLMEPESIVLPLDDGSIGHNNMRLIRILKITQLCKY